jgi:hypothetical protein
LSAELRPLSEPRADTDADAADAETRRCEDGQNPLGTQPLSVSSASVCVFCFHAILQVVPNNQAARGLPRTIASLHLNPAPAQSRLETVFGRARPGPFHRQKMARKAVPFGSGIVSDSVIILSTDSRRRASTDMTSLLHRRAFDRAVGTKHAAIARLGFEPRFAARTIIKILTGIRRHRFFPLEAALGTCNHRLEYRLEWVAWCAAGIVFVAHGFVSTLKPVALILSREIFCESYWMTASLVS